MSQPRGRGTQERAPCWRRCGGSAAHSAWPRPRPRRSSTVLYRLPRPGSRPPRLMPSQRLPPTSPGGGPFLSSERKHQPPAGDGEPPCLAPVPSLSLPYVFPEGVPVWLAPRFSVKDGDRFAPSDRTARPPQQTGRALLSLPLCWRASSGKFWRQAFLKSGKHVEMPAADPRQPPSLPPGS